MKSRMVGKGLHATPKLELILVWKAVSVCSFVLGMFQNYDIICVSVMCVFMFDSLCSNIGVCEIIAQLSLTIMTSHY